MPGGIVLVLVIVLWLFVLAPMWLRGQKPIRKAGEAFDETRVVYEGGSKLPRAVRAPRAGSAAQPTSEARRELEEDYELVDAADVVLDDAADQTDAARGAGPAVAPVLDGRVVHELEASEGGMERLSDEASDPAEFEHEAVDIAEKEFSAQDARVVQVPARLAPVNGEEYALEETFTSPEDLLYSPAGERPSTIRVLEDTSVFQPEGAPGAEDAGFEPAAAAQGREDAQEDRAAADGRHSAPSVDLTAEEREFAAIRAGRGGWDPEADEQVSLTRYQRRQRTLIGLGAAVLLSVVLTIVLGGWSWILCGLCLALTGAYLWALHSQVRQEQALRARRIQQLRRARMGVQHRDDEELQIPRTLRRPGAVVIELDDESPDFDHLPVVEGAFGDAVEDPALAGRAGGRLRVVDDRRAG